MKVLLSCPGPSLNAGTLRGVCLASSRHPFEVLTGSCAWDGFNGPWVDALNSAERGEATHFAMLHGDVIPDAGWLDVLIDEMDRTQADLISVVIPIKDGRGICSCGVGNPENTWTPLRRLAMREVMNLPGTFGAAELGYPGYPLLHNNGCWAADLRRKVFHRTDGNGQLLARFEFPRRVMRGKDGLFVQCESEDWFFSRQLHALGARTFLTRLVKLAHRGDCNFVNWSAWGSSATDEESGIKTPIGRGE